MIKVGCCGFPTSMKKYYERFKLVEINRTFYTYPKISTVTGWRDKAPSDFEFTVKAHQDITHKLRFKIKPSIQAFEQMKRICTALGARILLFQTPASFQPSKLSDALEFFGRVANENLTIVWETRGAEWEKPEAQSALKKALKQIDVPHVVDPFRSRPAYTSDTAYFRLHGTGRRFYYYQYTDEELKRLHTLTAEFERDDTGVYVLFNNLAMLEDAERFTYYLETGSFQKFINTVGLDSVRRILQKTRYLSTKNVLSQRLGWKLVQLKPDHLTRLDELISKLPSKPYRSLGDVMKEIEQVLE